jgi:hypothetical protein
MLASVGPRRPIFRGISEEVFGTPFVPRLLVTFLGPSFKKCDKPTNHRFAEPSIACAAAKTALLHFDETRAALLLSMAQHSVRASGASAAHGLYAG